MKIILVSIFLSFMVHPSFSQVDKNWLNRQLLRADSVILVSHLEVEGSDGEIMVDSIGDEIPYPKLIMAHKPNYKLVVESERLISSKRIELAQILSRPFQDKLITEGKCYMPHHAILLLKSDKISFIDLCFSCRSYKTSKDLQRLPDFDTKRWWELEAFFVKLGFQYGLSSNRHK
jgi:hypothetical protein